MFVVYDILFCRFTFIEYMMRKFICLYMFEQSTKSLPACHVLLPLCLFMPLPFRVLPDLDANVYIVSVEKRECNRQNMFHWRKSLPEKAHVSASSPCRERERGEVPTRREPRRQPSCHVCVLPSSSSLQCPLPPTRPLPSLPSLPQSSALQSLLKACRQAGQCHSSPGRGHGSAKGSLQSQPTTHACQRPGGRRVLRAWKLKFKKGEYHYHHCLPTTVPTASPIIS